MRKSDKVIALYFLFIIANVVFAWLAFFKLGTTPDTLLTLVLGMGGVVDVVSAVIVVSEKLDKKPTRARRKDENV